MLPISQMHELTADEFPPPRNNDGSPCLRMALEAIDLRTFEATRMLKMTRDQLMESNDDIDADLVRATLTGCIATLCMIAEPFDAIYAGIAELRKTAATHDAMTFGTTIA